VTADRAIGWQGFYNARDLGGLPTRDGRRTRFGAAIRSAELRFVTVAGWQAAHNAGVRTIIDLRNDDEMRPALGPRLTEVAGSAHFVPDPAGSLAPSGMRRVEVPLDGIEDVEFWQRLNAEGLNGTPLYYRPFLDSKTDHCAAVITAIARADPGGVLFHCGAGRDRTGLVTLLLLALVDVEPEAIAEDDGPSIAQALAARRTTARDAILATLRTLDAEQYLLTAGVTPNDLAAVRHRLLA